MALAVNGGNLAESAVARRGGAEYPSVATVALEETNTYLFGHYLESQSGHRFRFEKGQIVETSENAAEGTFFRVEGNTIFVSGVEVRFRLLSGSAFQDICMNSGCLAGNARVNRGGTDAIVHLPPADGCFNGVFSAVQFLTPSADRFDLFLAATNDVLALRCETDKAGTKFTRLAESSVRVVLSNGNVLEIQPTPPPPSSIRIAWRRGDRTGLRKLAENKKGEAELRAWA
jgi:hypothetical protein